VNTNVQGASPIRLLILAQVVALVTFGCGKKQEVTTGPPPEVKVVAAMQQDVPITREWVGQTIGAVDIEIRARVAGWLKSLNFSEGTEVKTGTLLYTIDTSELEQKVAAAKGQLAQSQTLLSRAQSDVDRYTPLAAAGAVSQRDLERAVAEFGSRKGEVEAAEASLKLAMIDMDYATITAPVDGLIGISAARVGDFVGRPPNPIILNTISRIDSIHVRFSITEQQYLELARRRQADATTPETRAQRDLQLILADGSEYPLPGHITLTQRQVDPATGTLQFEASFPNPNRILRPGQFAKIRAVVADRKAALVVPTRAITELQGQSLVYTVGKDNKVAMHRVGVGPQAGALTVIENGIATGDQVIVDGLQKVRPDMVVTTAPFTPAPDSAASDSGR
jgi:membrane fusion protein (multidrug efflux system)